MKKPFETEMDDTRQSVGQIVGLCTTIALHQEFGVGKTRLERIKARIDELENQNTEVIMTPDEALSWSGWGSRRVWIISGGVEP